MPCSAERPSAFAICTNFPRSATSDLVTGLRYARRARVDSTVFPSRFRLDVRLASSLRSRQKLAFEVIDTDLLMASDPDLIDRHRYLPTVDTP